MKKSSTPSPTSTKDPDDVLTEGDLRGLAAASKRAEALKKKYAAGHVFTPLPDHVSVMAGPVEKRD